MSDTSVTAGQSSGGLTVGDGDMLEVQSGGIVTNTTISSGGLANIAGSAADTQVESDGLLILSGGQASDTTLAGLNATMYVETGAATGTLISGGTEVGVLAGGFVADTTLAGGTVSVGDEYAFAVGSLFVSSGGLASGTVVNIGGLVIVEGGGSGTATTVSSGGSAIVNGGATVRDTLVLSGGIEIVSSGGTADAATVSSGAILLVLSGGTASGTVSAGGAVISGGVAVFSGGAVIATGSPSLSGTLVGADEQVVVYGGGSAVSAHIASGGSAAISAGGFGIALAVGSGGVDVVNAGGVASATIVSGGDERIEAGGEAIDSIVGVASVGPFGPFLYSDQNVDGGSTTGTVLDIDGTEYVASGMATGTVVNASGTLNDVGGTDSGTVIMAGGVETVQSSSFSASGGVAVSARVDSGGSQTVSAGGLTSGTVVSSGGIEIVSSGGVANATIVSSGGTLLVLAGGTASGTVSAGGAVISGGVVVLSGAAVAAGDPSLSGAQVGAGEQALVFSGGSAVSARITSGGSATISSGGLAIALSVGSGGADVVNAGGVASATVVSGGDETIEAGAAAIDSIVGVASAGQLGPLLYSYQYVEGGSTTGTVVDVDGTEYLQSGTATDTVVNASGSLIDNGGTDSGTVIMAGGVETVVSSMFAASGGVAVAASVASGGTQSVIGGGVASGSVIAAGGSQTVAADGLTSGTVVSSGGIEVVSSGGTATATTVLSGGLLLVLSGGVASGTVSAGGQVISAGVVILSGATVVTATSPSLSGAVVGPGEQELVLAGGSAVSSLIASGGSATIAGVALATSVTSGGAETVGPGGIASGSIVNGGSETVSSGGVALGSLVGTSGAVLYTAFGVLAVAGGSTTGTILVTEGFESIESGTALDTVVSGGSLDNDGGLDVDTTILDGTATVEGFFILSPAGSAVSATVASSGVQNVLSGGTATATLVQDHGSQTVGSGGVTSDTIVSNGGSEIVSSGGIADTTTVLSGGVLLLLSGAQASGTISGGGEVISGGVVVFSAGAVVTAGDPVLSGAVVGAGELEQVLAGGSAVSAFIGSGGSATVDGVALATSVGSDGTQTIASGGLASATTVLAGGQEDVATGGSTVGTLLSGSPLGDAAQLIAGGSATGTTIAANGSVDVTFGGIGIIQAGMATDTVVDAGGSLLETVGTSISATINSGGAESVGAFAGFGSGLSSATTLNNGAAQTVSSGGVADGTVVNSGGSETVYSSGTASGTLIGSGGVEVIASGGIAEATQVLSGGELDLAYLPYTATGSASIGATDLLTVTEGAETATLQLAGDYTDEIFDAAMDSSGAAGTLLTLESVPCYCRGTLIATDRGDIPVEDLVIGDRLRTLSGALRPLRWIGRRAYSARFAAGNPELWPIRIRAGALADGVPRRDLFVSPRHGLYLRDVLIPAAALVNAGSVVAIAPSGDIEYLHLDLGVHDILLAEGAPAESFIDDTSRGLFHNAAEFQALYPNAVAMPRCAPLVEDGPILEDVQRALTTRATAPERARSGELTGNLEIVERARIAGWARDLGAPDQPVRLLIRDHGATIAEVVADVFRPDLAQAGIGQGCHSFDFRVPGGLSPLHAHSITVERAADGAPLPNAPRHLPAEAAPAPLAPAEATCPGALDQVTRTRIAGWAWDADQPHTQVALSLFANGAPLARVLANRYRADLAQAGIGNGLHGFDLRLPGGLAPLERHVIEVRRERDGAAVGAPTVIEPATQFDAGLEAVIAQGVTALQDSGAQARALAFLTAQAARLRQQQAEDQPAAPRVLVVDERVPAADRDAGSQAILSHMRALQELGYAVSFIAADSLAEPAPALAAAGITRCGGPFDASVEELLRRQADAFDLVYLHRAGIAARYLGLARHTQPRARVVYNVADLHHLRLERQAAVEARPELLPESRRLRLAECTAARSADAVITHSVTEAAWLRRAVPGAQVHHIGWEIPERTPRVAFAERQGVAFIAGFGHAPNRDAALWLVEEIMPLVWRQLPALPCLLVGSEMPAAVRRLGGPDVEVLGHVADLGTVFDRVRLTVAPLRYGAGVKGKVLASLAAGVACAMSTVAAEGLGLPGASDAAGLAALIVRLHGDEAAADAAVSAGRALLRRDFCGDAVVAGLGAVVRKAERLARCSNLSAFLTTAPSPARTARPRCSSPSAG